MSVATSESPNIRISPKAKATLRELSKREGRPMQAVLDEAIERYRRETFLDQANAAYARLRKDPKAWRQELAERAEWDGTLMDGLSEK
jgi:predicted DNA-binding protein